MPETQGPNDDILVTELGVDWPIEENCETINIHLARIKSISHLEKCVKCTVRFKVTFSGP